MSSSGLHTYAPLLLHLLIAAALAGALTAVSVLVGWRRPSRAKQQPYECGMEPTGVRSLRWYGFVEMMIYIAILLVGYLYLWKKGALDWHK